AATAEAEGVDPGRPDGDLPVSGSGVTRGPRRRAFRRASRDGSASAPVGAESLAQRAREPRTTGASARTDRRAAFKLGAVRYLLIYYGGSMPDTPAQQARVMKQWTAWFTKLGPAIVDPGNPVSGKVNKLKPDGEVATGPVGPRASGYSIIGDPSLEAETEPGTGWPVIRR